MEGLPLVWDDCRIPVKVWAFGMEEEAERQIRNVANHPFAFHHIAIMPDVHSGYGICIGGVVAFEGAICSNMVGVDIGCGMRAVKTSLQGIETDILKNILGDIRNSIPVGFDHNKTKSDLPPMIERKDFEMSKVVKTEWESAAYQIGSLGGGK